MKHLLLVPLLFCLGCNALSRTIHTSEISGTTNRVLNRHDTYVAQDSTLDAGTRALDLAQSAEVRTAIQKPNVAASEISTPLTAVADRHDVYTKADPSLVEYKRKANLQDTAILRTVLKSGTTKASQ